MSATDPDSSFEQFEARALAFERELKLTEARDAFDQALRLDPSSQSCAEGRARIAIQFKEQGATEHCARALAFHEADPALQLQMIGLAARELGSAAIPLLESFLERHPLDVDAHELLAELRAQAGAGDGFVDTYRQVLAEHPRSKLLLMSYWDVLSRSGRHLPALDSMEEQRALFEGDRDFAMLEVAIAGHAGLTDRVVRILETLDDRPDAQLARAQTHLQTGRPDEAVRLLEEVVALQPDNLTAWALIEPAWRMVGDDRHDWLVGQPGLYGTTELELEDEQLSRMATVLRSLHRASAQPVGQSVRGGTQTAGDLLTRTEPEIQLLTETLAAAIRQFHSKLPPTDPSHPLLKHRDQGMAFGPSWSVRLQGGGFHVAHFHPAGILSSACYISLPEEMTAGLDQEGWLEIGRPPPELNIDLPPLATFEPKPGRLVLFPSFLFHGTRPFGGGERLTIAFDLLAVPPR